MVLFQGNPKRYDNREVSLTWGQLIGECWRLWGKGAEAASGLVP